MARSNIKKAQRRRNWGGIAGRAIGALVLALIAGSAMAGTIEPGQLVVVRVEYGESSSGGTAAAPMFLDVYDLSGTPPLTPVQTIALPTEVSGAHRRCTAQRVGQTTFMTQSADGRFLVLGGFNAPVGGATTTTGSTVERVIARVSMDGTIDTTTTMGPTGIPGVYVGITGGTIRGAFTVDGTSFWTSGHTLAGATTTRGLHYQAFGSSAAPVQIHATPAPGGGYIDSYRGQMYHSWAVGTTSSVYTVGTGLPTTTATVMPILTTPGAQSTEEMFFSDSETLYLADSSGGTGPTAGIEKWVFQNGVWTFAYRLLNDGTSGIRCSTLTGTVVGGQVTLYAVETTSTTNAPANGNGVRMVVDTGPGAMGTTIISAPPLNGLRGMRYVLPAGACCNDADQTCMNTTIAGCPAGSTFQGGGTTCSPSSCGGQPTGVCCRGATCSRTVASGDCTASGTAGAVFVAGGSACNSGSTATPCCYADYNKVGGISVQDVFDFLGDYFSGSPNASVGGDGTGGAPTVQSIFDFLAAYFAGGC